MKKIAVLTDFSEPATHAAAYAFQLASRLQADILLYHALVVPAINPMAAQIAWPMETYDELEKNSAVGLQELSIKIRKQGEQLPYDGYIPSIETQCYDEALDQCLRRLEMDQDVKLVVVGTHHDSLSTLFTGHHIPEIINAATIPLLIVPMDIDFRPLKKVVFASALESDDLQIAISVSALTRVFGGKLTIAHIRHHPEAEAAISRLQEHLSEAGINNEVDYLEIIEKNINKGLKTIRDQQTYDLLIMVHHQQSIWQRLFGTSQTNRAAKELRRPLMIFPRPHNQLRGF